MFYVQQLNFIFTQLYVKFHYFLIKQIFPYSKKGDMIFRMILKNLSKKTSDFFCIFQHFRN